MVNQDDINNFKGYFLPWGYLDVERAVEIIKEYDLDETEIQEQIEDFCESCDVKIEDIDVVSQVYDHILQMARNRISNVLDYDFQNDFSGGTEIYTAGNYLATSYDYSEEAKEELQEKLNKATDEQKEQLKENVYFNAFIDLMDLEIK